jgi:hypothetical protein
VAARTTAPTTPITRLSCPRVDSSAAGSQSGRGLRRLVVCPGPLRRIMNNFVALRAGARSMLSSEDEQLITFEEY